MVCSIIGFLICFSCVLLWKLGAILTQASLRAFAACGLESVELTMVVPFRVKSSGSEPPPGPSSSASAQSSKEPIAEPVAEYSPGHTSGPSCEVSRMAGPHSNSEEMPHAQGSAPTDPETAAGVFEAEPASASVAAPAPSAPKLDPPTWKYEQASAPAPVPALVGLALGTSPKLASERTASLGTTGGGGQQASAQSAASSVKAIEIEEFQDLPPRPPLDFGQATGVDERGGRRGKDVRGGPGRPAKERSEDYAELAEGGTNPPRADAQTEDGVDRTRVPRLPWQDVAVGFGGCAARDAALHFVCRWNHHR